MRHFQCNFFKYVVIGDAEAVAFTNGDNLKTLRQSQTVFRANSFDVRECSMMGFYFYEFAEKVTIDRSQLANLDDKTQPYLSKQVSTILRRSPPPRQNLKRTTTHTNSGDRIERKLILNYNGRLNRKILMRS